jgi:hypothetical protein
MPVNHIHVLTVDSAKFENLVEEISSEASADDNAIIAPCFPDKTRAESTRYWNGVKLYKSRMRHVPVKRVFSPIA